MTSRPGLETDLPRQGKNATISFAVALGATASLCGVLASLKVVISHFTEEESASPIITEVAQSRPKPTLRPQASTPIHNPEFSKPIAPQHNQADLRLPDPIAPELTAPLVPSPVTFDSLVLDEIDSTELFEDTPTKPKNKSTKPSPPEVDHTARKKKETERITSLSTKISRQASIATRSLPHYPRSARRSGHQGRTVILVTVAINGTAHSPRVIQSSGHPSLDQSALKAALKHRFNPALNALGKPIAVQRQLPFSFKLTS
ncbi:MAG: energy transducer TonB [Akkermansiaceae bacterium]